jgi:hypothetical protein
VLTALDDILIVGIFPGAPITEILSNVYIPLTAVTTDVPEIDTPVLSVLVVSIAIVAEDELSSTLMLPYASTILNIKGYVV